MNAPSEPRAHTGLGPDYIDFDMRLTWAHKLGEKSNLQFTAEGFNIANAQNFASVNNEVSPLFGFTRGSRRSTCVGFGRARPYPVARRQHPARRWPSPPPSPSARSSSACA